MKKSTLEALANIEQHALAAASEWSDQVTHHRILAISHLLGARRISNGERLALNAERKGYRSAIAARKTATP